LSIDLAQLQERLGRADGAIGTYEEWLRREPKSQVAANNLAMLLITHKPADAAALKRALDLTLPFQSSANAAFLDTLGWVRFTRGEFTEAVAPLQRAVDLAPRVPSLRARLGLAQYKAGQRGAAKGNLETAFKGEVAFPEKDQARAALDDLSRG
jgi:tetratricopeptide (TPR) repeat protein